MLWVIGKWLEAWFFGEERNFFSNGCLTILLNVLNG
jgi:hypothetical protein